MILTYWRIFDIKWECKVKKRRKRQFTKHRRRLRRKRNILHRGPYLILDKSRWNFLRLKIKRWIFLVLKALGLKPIMIEKVRFVSCIVAKFLSFINHCLNFFKKLEVMVQNQNRWGKFSNSTSEKAHLWLFLINTYFLKNHLLLVSCVVVWTEKCSSSCHNPDIDLVSVSCPRPNLPSHWKGSIVGLLPFSFSWVHPSPLAVIQMWWLDPIPIAVRSIPPKLSWQLSLELFQASGSALCSSLSKWVFSRLEVSFVQLQRWKWQASTAKDASLFLLLSRF